MGRTSRRLGRSIFLLVGLLAKVILALVAAWVVSGIAYYSLRQVFPIASLDPTKVYDTVLEIKRDWPAFEREIPESDREKHREIIAFLKATDAGALVVIALLFNFVLIIIALQIYMIILILLLFVWYLFDRLDRPPGAMEERTA